MANATDRKFPFPVNQISTGAVAGKAVAFDWDNGMWLFSCNGTPVNGAAGTGTGAGFAAPGSLAVDRVGKAVYLQTGTTASVVWEALALFAEPEDPDGLAPTPLSLLAFKNADGTAMAAAAASGKLGVSVTLGTSLFLIGEAATSSGPLTDNAIAEFIMPPNYIAGDNVTLTINAQKVGAGTTTLSTVGAFAYLNAESGTQGATLIATAAAVVGATAADHVFVITGTTLVPGSRLTIEVQTKITETAGTATHIQVNALVMG